MFCCRTPNSRRATISYFGLIENWLKRRAQFINDRNYNRIRGTQRRFEREPLGCYSYGTSSTTHSNAGLRLGTKNNHWQALEWVAEVPFFYFAAVFLDPWGHGIGDKSNSITFPRMTGDQWYLRSRYAVIRACILNEDSKSIWSRRPGIVLVDLLSNILTLLLWFDQLWVARGGGGARLGFFVFRFSLSFVFNICLASTDWRVVVSHDVRR